MEKVSFILFADDEPINALNKIMPEIMSCSTYSHKEYEIACIRYIVSTLYTILNKTLVARTINNSATDFLEMIGVNVILNTGQEVCLVDYMSGSCIENVLTEIIEAVEIIRIASGIFEQDKIECRRYI